MTGLVYSYMRFSDPKQEAGSSIARQRAYAEKWAADHSTLLDTSLSMQDHGLSAYHQRHVTEGAFGAFLEAIKTGRVAPGSTLVVEQLDRLSRASPLTAITQLTGIVLAGVRVITVKDKREFSKESLTADPSLLQKALTSMILAHEESANKSERVTEAIVLQCNNWINGTYRGKIRNGKDPQWLRETESGYEAIPARVEALTRAVQMYIAGHSGLSITRRLAETGSSPIANSLTAPHWYKIVKNPALVGTKRLTAGGQDFELRGYYPPVIDEDTWLELQAVADLRVRKGGTKELPHVITGLGITYCGYCGTPMSGQNMLGRLKDRDSRFLPGCRRLLCAAQNYGSSCPHPTSRSVQPVERAIVGFCSDMMNLRSLYSTDDPTSPLREELANLRDRLAEVDVQSKRLLDVVLAGDGTPAAILSRKAQDLETERKALVRQISQCETRMGAIARTDLTSAEEKWRELADAAVEQLDPDARMKARKLIGDTFSRITIYSSGVRPRAKSKVIDLVLVARGGASRALRIDLKGNWQLIDHIVAPIQ